jgi:hypothetical protein
MAFRSLRIRRQRPLQPWVKPGPETADPGLRRKGEDTGSLRSVPAADGCGLLLGLPATGAATPVRPESVTRSRRGKVAEGESISSTRCTFTAARDSGS